MPLIVPLSSVLELVNEVKRIAFVALLSELVGKGDLQAVIVDPFVDAGCDQADAHLVIMTDEKATGGKVGVDEAEAEVERVAANAKPIARGERQSIFQRIILQVVVEVDPGEPHIGRGDITGIICHREDIVPCFYPALACDSGREEGAGVQRSSVPPAPARRIGVNAQQRVMG